MRRRLAVFFAAVIGVVLGLSGPPPSSATGPDDDACTPNQPGVATFTSTATNANWDDKENWNVSYVPGSIGHIDIAVCIPADASVVLDDSLGSGPNPSGNGAGPIGGAEIQALTVQAGAKLTVGVDGKLFLVGEATSWTSVVAKSGAFVFSGLLGGPGTLRIDGRTSWVREPGAASTMTTDWCHDHGAYGCSASWSTAGTTVISPGGSLTITGANGVDLGDRRHVEVAGTFTISGDSAYLAADDGTSMHVASGGSLVFRGDGDIYQGFTASDGATGGPFRLVDDGSIVKSGGTGLSSINADRSGSGSVKVASGQLTFNDQAPTASVKQGRTYGIGGCADPGDAAGCTEPDPSRLDGTAPALTVTLPAVDSSYGSVRMTDLPGDKTSDDLVDPVLVHESNVSSSHAHPQVLRLWIDGTDAGGTAPGDVQIFRSPEGGTAYVGIPACTSKGHLKSSQSSCVDRRTSQTKTVGDDDDIVVVVRTIATKSRWVGR